MNTEVAAPLPQTPFLAEVAEQPAALDRLAHYYRHEGRTRLRLWRQLAETHGRVIFAGMGTSEFAPEAILARLGQQGIDATTYDAGELLHYPRPIPGLLVLVSQSGESVETRRLVEAAARGTDRVALTNAPQSALARHVRLVLPLLAGPESAIAAKTYVNTLALLHLLAQPENTVPQALDELTRVAASMPLVARDRIEAAAEALADATAIHFIGRGPTMAAVKQAALTFMEGAKVSAIPHTGGAFRHGPLELAGDSLRGVIFAPGGRTGELLIRLADELARLGGRVVLFTDQPDPPVPASVRVIPVPDHGEDLFNLTVAPTQELLLDALARRRGRVAGQFCHGRKITTTE